MGYSTYASEQMANSIPNACTLILGAGVSAPYGFPLGAGLVSNIVGLNREACAGALNVNAMNLVLWRKTPSG